MRRPKAVIMDLDGCLVDTRSTRQYVIGPEKDFDAFHLATLDCPPNEDVAQWMEEKYRSGHIILVMTGRKTKWRKITVEWLEKHAPCPWVGVFMRPEDDHRPSADFKRERLHSLLKNYDIVGAADDDPSVVAMYREECLPEVFHKAGWDDAVAAAYTDRANREDIPKETA